MRIRTNQATYSSQILAALISTGLAGTLLGSFTHPRGAWADDTASKAAVAAAANAAKSTSLQKSDAGSDSTNQTAIGRPDGNASSRKGYL